MDGIVSLLKKSEGVTSLGGATVAIGLIANFTIPAGVSDDPKLLTVVTIVQIVTIGLLAASAIMSYNASRGRAKAGEEGVKK